MIEIVAECGVNWRSINEAMGLASRAKDAGADSAKFQVYNDDVIQRSPLYDDLKRIMLDKEACASLLNHGREIDCEVFFSVMYPEAVDFLEEIGVKKYKIREKDGRALVSEEGGASPVSPTPLIERAIQTHKPVYISVQRKPLDMHWLAHPQISWLYCLPKYPAPLEELELWKCGLDYGFSCHTPDVVAPVVAATMMSHTRGEDAHRSRVLEVHVSDEPKSIYIDGNVSFNFDELAQIVKAVRKVETINLAQPF